MTSKEIKISKGLENGLGFSCKMCGVCCRGFNEGEVYIFKNDFMSTGMVTSMVKWYNNLLKPIGTLSQE